MANTHLDFKKMLRFEIALIVLFLATSGLYAGNLLPIQFETQILAIVGIIGLIPVAKSAFFSLQNKKINVDLLATIALLFSFISAEWSSMLFINLMLTLARILDLYTKRRVRVSLESLTKLKPAHARILRGEEAVSIPLAEVRKGDLVAVNLGEQIPVDGTITEGSATINQASLTGESIPVFREAGNAVLSATVVVSGNIIVRTERIGAETTFEKMVGLVEASQGAKTRMKTLAEKFSSWYISIVLIGAIILYLATKDTRLVLAVVLVVCADDIAIAVPLAYVAAVGTAARRGIIIKSADFLERAAEITTLVVDKTGTLTLGNLAVKDVHVFGDNNKAELLEIVGGICSRSTHPVSVAIKKFTTKSGSESKQPDQTEEVEGLGIVGSYEGKKVMLGSRNLFEKLGKPVSEEVQKLIIEKTTQGENVTLVAVEGNIVGIFSLADEMREGTIEAMGDLKKGGVKEIIMLTGDNEGVAKNIAGMLGISKHYSNLLPEHKLFVLKDYLGKNNRTVAMVGDGVNDAAVLSLSDVGIAMGDIGSDVAIESADVVLMQDDFKKIVELRAISKKVRGAVRANFAIWGVINAIGLYLVFTHVLDPKGAAAYNFLTDFIPIANSLRLLRYKEPLNQQHS